MNTDDTGSRKRVEQADTASGSEHPVMGEDAARGVHGERTFRGRETHERTISVSAWKVHTEQSSTK